MRKRIVMQSGSISIAVSLLNLLGRSIRVWSDFCVYGVNDDDC